jgi:hypothetical protein
VEGFISMTPDPRGKRKSGKNRRRREQEAAARVIQERAEAQLKQSRTRRIQIGVAVAISLVCVLVLALPRLGLPPIPSTDPLRIALVPPSGVSDLSNSNVATVIGINERLGPAEWLGSPRRPTATIVVNYRITAEEYRSLRPAELAWRLEMDPRIVGIADPGGSVSFDPANAVTGEQPFTYSLIGGKADTHWEVPGTSDEPIAMISTTAFPPDRDIEDAPDDEWISIYAALSLQLTAPATDQRDSSEGWSQIWQIRWDPPVTAVIREGPTKSLLMVCHSCEIVTAYGSDEERSDAQQWDLSWGQPKLIELQTTWYPYSVTDGVVFWVLGSVLAAILGAVGLHLLRRPSPN